MSIVESEVSQSHQRENDNGENTHSNSNLESKVMQVGNQKYYIDMKQSAKARFFKIVEVMSRHRNSRLVVPMSIASDFCQKLAEMDTFASNYDPSKHVKEGQGEFIQSLALSSPGHRRYYFDMSDTGSFLNLKISYVFGERRDNVNMVSDAIVEILNILKGFMERYPPLPGQEEEDVNFRPPQRRNNFDRNRRFYDSYQLPNRPQYSLPNRPQYPRPNNDNQNRRNGQSSVPLKVLEDPAPASIVLNQKGFLFEVVQGTNTFIRITETVYGNKKSTLHIPAEACAQFKDLIERFSTSVNLTEGNEVSSQQITN